MLMMLQCCRGFSRGRVANHNPASGRRSNRYNPAKNVRSLTSHLRFEAGKCADFFSIDLNTVDYAGALHDPVVATLFCASQKACHTVINGQVVVEHGRVVTVDMEPVIEANNRFAGNSRAAAARTDLPNPRRGKLAAPLSPSTLDQDARPATSSPEPPALPNRISRRYRPHPRTRRR